MPTQQTHLHLLAYDIADPKRLTRVHRCLRGWGVPLQYSVWLVPARDTDLHQLTAQVESKIDHDNDDVRIYRLPGHPLIETLGRPRFQPGVSLLGTGVVDKVMGQLLGAGTRSGD